MCTSDPSSNEEVRGSDHSVLRRLLRGKTKITYTQILICPPSFIKIHTHLSKPTNHPHNARLADAARFRGGGVSKPNVYFNFFF